MSELILNFLCVELVPISLFSLVGRRREAGRVFHIRASYVRYYFVILVLWLKGISAVRVVLRILFGLSRGSRLLRKLIKFYLHCFSPLLSSPYFSELIIKFVT